MSISRQRTMENWVISRLGKDAMNQHERTLRFLEESFELGQAAGVSKTQALRLLRSVYKKPIGVISQEIGGVGTTLLALCASQNVDMLATFDKETTRIHHLPPEKFRKRQKLNIATGIGTK